SWWDRRRRLGLTVSAHTPVDGVVAKSSKFGREQLIDFRWELAVGDETLTDDDIAALAAAKTPLIRLRGQWVALDPDQLRRGRLALLVAAPCSRAVTVRGRTPGRLHRVAAALPAARPVLAGVLVLARPGQLPGRRYGPG